MKWQLALITLIAIVILAAMTYILIHINMAPTIESATICECIGILKTSNPGTVIMGAADDTPPADWLDEFRRKNRCPDHPNCRTEICPELLDRYEAIDTGQKTLIEMHYTHYCTYCKRMTPVFTQVLNEFTNGLGNEKYDFKLNDVMENPVRGIRSVPSIFKYDGKHLSKYKGQADYDMLKEWVLTPPSRTIDELRTCSKSGARGGSKMGTKV